MMYLYTPIFPCNIEVESKNLLLDVIDEGDGARLVKFSEGWGCYKRSKSYWISDEEKEKLGMSSRNIKIFSFPGEYVGWRSCTPTELEIEVTNTCNQRCIHCFNESGEHREVLSSIIVKTIIKEFSQKGGQRVLLTGGEPFLYKGIENILYTIKENGISSLEIVSNGTMINRDIAKKLSSYVDYINISLHGPTAKVHDSVTRTEGSFNSAINGINLLRKYNVDVLIYFTIMEENIKSIPEMIRLVKDLDCAGIRFNCINSMGRAKSKKAINPEAKRRLSHLITSFANQCGVRLIPSELYRKDDFNNIENYKFFGCNAFRTLIYVCADGTVIPCSLYYRPMGDVHKSSLSEIWNGDEAKNLLRSYCAKECNYRTCGGICRAI